jgi:hypothetical protein
VVVRVRSPVTWIGKPQSSSTTLNGTNVVVRSGASAAAGATTASALARTMNASLGIAASFGRD